MPAESERLFRNNSGRRMDRSHSGKMVLARASLAPSEVNCSPRQTSAIRARPGSCQPILGRGAVQIGLPWAGYIRARVNGIHIIWGGSVSRCQ
jgi:hypothetical protein